MVKLNPKVFINSFNPQHEYFMLKKQAKHGLVLAKIDEDKYAFTEHPNQEPHYFIDFFQSASLGNNKYLLSKTELGWRYLGSVQDWHYFIADAEKEPARVYSDFRPYIKRITKSIPVNLFLTIVLFALFTYYEVYYFEIELFNSIILITLAGVLSFFSHRLTSNILTIQYLRNIKIEDQATFGE